MPSTDKFNYGNLKVIVSNTLARFGISSSIIQTIEGDYDVAEGKNQITEVAHPCQAIFTEFQFEETVSGVIPSPENVKIVVDVENYSPEIGDHLVTGNNKYRVELVSKAAPDNETVIVYIIAGLKIEQ